MVRISVLNDTLKVMSGAFDRLSQSSVAQFIVFGLLGSGFEVTFHLAGHVQRRETGQAPSSGAPSF